MPDKIRNILRFLAGSVFFILLPAISQAKDSLLFLNHTETEIIDALLQPQKGEEFFLRLDLMPGGKAEFENPACVANIRIDTGFALLFFEGIDLRQYPKLTLERNNTLQLAGIVKEANKTLEPVKIVPLTPQKGERPVCELGRFVPKMPMSDVCRIVPEETPRDDNGSLLAGLGFGGMVWAGRLAPEQEAAGEDVRLEHMELRRVFSKDDLDRLLSHLFRQGYVPWQCEFPRADLDFADMPDKNPPDRRAVLLDVVRRYLSEPLSEQSEATIMLAPENSLEFLANADAPEQDVQLFTIILRPQSHLLLLDVAAYEGQGKAAAEKRSAS